MSHSNAVLTVIDLEAIRPAPEPAEPKPAPAVEAPWPNLHAPDAARASSAEAIRLAPAGRNRALRAFLANPTAMIGLFVLSVIVLTAFAAPLLFPDDPLSMVARPLLWPGQNPRFPLGTDTLGRDVLAGLVHGSRVSLLIGATATLVSLAAGIVVGALAG